MHQGNWTCSKCGGAITQLPFEPRSNSGLTCRECYFKEKDRGASGGDSASVSAPDMPGGAVADIDDRDVPDFDPDTAGVASEPTPDSPDRAAAPTAEKKLFTGDWQCGTCGASITELPFEPRGNANLKCKDCFMKSRG